MIDKKKLADLKGLVDESQKIVIVIAGNIDGDGLASAVALENIFDQLKKEVVVHCAVNIPEYLHFVEGWDRVVADFPEGFDLAVMVDCSTSSLLDVAGVDLTLKRQMAKGLKLVIIDHHPEN